MGPAEEAPAPAHSVEEPETKALDRYYERRLDEIRRHEPSDENKFIPLERLQELAGGSSSGSGPARPRVTGTTGRSTFILQTTSPGISRAWQSLP